MSMRTELESGSYKISHYDREEYYNSSNQTHRRDGPAITIYGYGGNDVKLYYINGRQFSHEEFLNMVAPNIHNLDNQIIDIAGARYKLVKVDG